MEMAYRLRRGRNRFEQKGVVVLIERLSAGHDSLKSLFNLAALRLSIAGVAKDKTACL